MSDNQPLGNQPPENNLNSADPTAPTGEASVGTTDMNTNGGSHPNAGGGTDTGITGDSTAGGGLTGHNHADVANLSGGTDPMANDTEDNHVVI